ncbi:hypothetical protein [Actinoplanes sp. CA-252034]|uniref:hypothetical protein n=1 Tax=Actinoplanes sp. CA-252034 TaxID=3239906 RepID=UPI003D95AA5B
MLRPLGALPTVLVEEASAERSGIAAALHNNAAVVGGALAGGGFAALTARLTPSGTAVPAEESLVLVWPAAAGCAAFAAGAALRSRSGRAMPRALSPAGC